MATDIAEPTDRLVALCHHAVRCTIICFIVPLSCNQGSLGSQRVVLAHFAAAALRTAIASGPIINACLPSVQVAIWTLNTYPPDLQMAVWFDVNGAKVGISSMVPLLLKSYFKAADIWAGLPYMLVLT